jgi:hypothetical protein
MGATAIIAAALCDPAWASAAEDAALQVRSTLPVVVSAGATQPPPDSTELPDCNEFNPQSRALGATDNPQITKVEGGGTKYSYAVPGASDEYITVSEPPTGFDPLAASDAELQTWGLPPRPSNEAGREQWREMVGSYKYTTPHESCRQTDPNRVHAYQGSFFSGNWSGYENEASNNRFKWHAVMGNTYMAVDHGSCNPSADVAQWVGLGGNGAGFIQAGVENRSGIYYEAWIEWWSGNQRYYYEPVLYQGGAPYIVGPNQFIRMYVGYNWSLEEYYVYLTNDYTGQTELVQGKIGHQFYDGSTAEWIDEAPGQLPLLNFGEITWWNATTQNEANQVLPATYYPLWKVTAGSSSQHLTMAPGMIWNGQNWSDYYYQCT